MRTCLLDTGPLVAYLAGDDPAHHKVAAWLDGFAGQLVTTSAVITEAMHFVTGNPDGPAVLAEFALSSGLLIQECAQPAQLRQAAALMRRYADTPMDFADATLVLLADELSVVNVLTLDRRGFSTYRTPRGKILRRVLTD